MKYKKFPLVIFFVGLMLVAVSIRAQDYLVDATFNPTFGGRTHQFFDRNNAVAIQPDQKILIGGNFTTVNGESSPLIVRLNADGTRDQTFNSPLGAIANDEVVFIKLQPDGKMLVGGIFRVSVNPTYLVRLNQDGSLDQGFNFITAYVKDIELYPDGRFMVCGSIAVNGNERKLARFHPNGAPDESFQVNINGNQCLDVELSPDGDVYAGGTITGVDGVGIRGLVRLNSDGTRDTAFTLPAENFNFISREFYRLALQPDGKLLGSYRLTYTDSQQELSSVAGINRYETTGAVQQFSNCSTANASASNFIFLQNDGRIITSGCRAQTNAATYLFARLHPDGVLDTALNRINFDNVTTSVARQADGKYLVIGSFGSVDGVQRQRIVRLKQNLAPASRRFDFDGDGKSDLSVFRPSAGYWYISNSSNNSIAFASLGVSTDKIAPADYDGDGKTDITVFRNGNWYWLSSSNNQLVTYSFGATGDIPVPGDFDADGKADYAVFRPSNGFWYRLNSSNYQFAANQFGTNGDLPQIADLDGDGKSDVTVFRPSNSTWYALMSANNAFFGMSFGSPGDIPTPADYDGDGKTDISVFRPSLGTWYRMNSSNNSFFGQQFGAAGDIPVGADYDGDGKSDLAVFRQGNWYLLRSTAGFTGQQFGVNSDIPAPSAFGQ